MKVINLHYRTWVAVETFIIYFFNTCNYCFPTEQGQVSVWVLVWFWDVGFCFPVWRANSKWPRTECACTLFILKNQLILSYLNSYSHLGICVYNSSVPSLPEALPQHAEIAFWRDKAWQSHWVASVGDRLLQGLRKCFWFFNSVYVNNKYLSISSEYFGNRKPLQWQELVNSSRIFIPVSVLQGFFLLPSWPVLKLIFFLLKKKYSIFFYQITTISKLTLPLK